MNRKGCGRNKSYLILRYYSGICLEEMKRTVKHINGDSRCPDRDSNRPLPKYKSEALPLEPVNLFFFLVSLGGVRLSPIFTSATVGLLYQPRKIYDDYGTVGGMRIGRGNRSTRRKPAPVPLFPPQIPHDLGSNPGRRSGKPATNRLSHGTASQ
jgi:hypothetical protein